MPEPVSTTSSLILPASARSLSEDIAIVHTSLFPYLTPKSRVALWRLPSHLSLPIYFVLYQAGCTPVWLNSRWNLREASRAIESLRIKIVILPPGEQFVEDIPRFYASRSFMDIPVIKATALDETSSIHPVFSPPQPSIFFTSGTTSAPKAVLLSHSTILTQALAKHTHVPYTSSTVYLHLAPLHHVGGHCSAVSVTLANGVHVFPPDDWRATTHSEQLLRYAQQKGVNSLVVVPAILQLLLDVGMVMSEVTTILYGAGRISRRLLEQTRIGFPNASIVGAYGMTETASSITFLRHADFPARSPFHESAGIPPAHVQIRIDPVNGEVLTRGPHVMSGYVGEKPIQGWFRTGDAGFLDGDCLFLSGRLKDMIKTGGENVFTGEVEDALLRCTEVREAAVVGVPHRVLGEAVAAAVVVDASSTFGKIAEELKAICTEVLTPFKRPRWIVEQPALPRNSTGKVIKEIVRQRVEVSLFPTAKL